MQMFRKSQLAIGVMALAVLFGGCKGESPTAPSTTTTPSPGGTTTPPATATITLSPSSANPLVDSTSVITATVTQNGAAVANGTAVEFSTSLGTFTESNAKTVIRTTTNGVATATLTSSTVGPATVTATVGSASKTASVTFTARPVTPPPPDLSPTITGVAPTLGRPQGGEVVTISGTNFVAPVRVLFDFGAANGGTKEATVISVTPTAIQVLTPAIDLAAAQQAQATITVINAVGTPNETRVTSAANAFTFQSQVLTPKVTTAAPSSGPIDGGTRVTIFGSGFQSPVQVFFGAAEAQVINVTFDQIVVVSPTARDTTPSAGETFTGFVDVRIVNINSATQTTAPALFRYIPKMQITAISPTFGSALGGTQVRIDGTGFNDPVTVDIGGVRAQTIRVSGTQIVASTGALASPCTASGGTVTITNVDNGDVATSTQTFSYIAVHPIITTVTGSGTVQPGGIASFGVLNPGVGLLGTATVAGTFNAVAIVLSPNVVSSPTGTQNFNFAVPTNVGPFNTQACTSSGIPGTQQIATAFPLVFRNATTGCASDPTSVIVQPLNSACVTVPAATVSPASVPCPGPSATVGTSAAPFNLTVSNVTPAGGQSLNVTGVTSSSGDFLVSPTSATAIAPGTSVPFSVTFTPSAVGNRPATITFTTNDPARPTITVQVCGTGS